MVSSAEARAGGALVCAMCALCMAWGRGDGGFEIPPPQSLHRDACILLVPPPAVCLAPFRADFDSCGATPSSTPTPTPSPTGPAKASKNSTTATIEAVVIALAVVAVVGVGIFIVRQRKRSTYERIAA